MAGQQGYQNTMQWIADEQTIHETADYGGNKSGVGDAVSSQQHRVKLVRDYKNALEKTITENKDKEGEVQGAYDALEAVASKRLGCLEDIQQIAGLEDLFGTLTSEFAQRATKLVESECQRAAESTKHEASVGDARAAQNCILAVRSNWCWISKLVRCADVHLQHVSDYHQFFHEVAEYDHWMPADLQAATAKVAGRADMPSDQDEANKLLVELKEVLTMFLHWQGKVDALFDKSRKIMPVHLRTTKLDYFRPVSALCDYKTKEVCVREGEELTLTDNGDSQSWQVRNMHNKDGKVPAVILVIPGPDPTAVDSACRLRFQLLEIWTQNVKRIGKSLIWFMILCLRDWTEDEVKSLKAMPTEQKDEIRRVLTFIETSLLPYWADYAGFKELQRRITVLREILDQQGDAKDHDPNLTDALVAQVGIVEDLLKRYKDYWSHWDTYRIIVETCRAPEFLLIVERWQQLKYLEMDELRRRWHTGFGFGDEDLDEFMEWMERWTEWKKTTIIEEVVESTEAMTLEGSMEMSGSVETATSEQITTSEQEEKKTFVITGVIDPRTQKEVTMQEAVAAGIINSSAGMYVNLVTGEQYPIPVAMNAGYIKVEFTSTKKTAEKRRDVGLITIRTQRESRPYTVKAVVDAQTERRLTVDEAIAVGILDQASGTYKNLIDQSIISLADAIDSNLLLVEYDKDAEVGEPEIVSKTFAIHSVVDQRAKKTVTFSQAIRKGLLDKETGAYFHNINNDYMYVGDAIKRGFIKATVVRDPNSLDIDPENKMVVEKVQNIRKKLLNPMKALAALKKAAASEEAAAPAEQAPAAGKKQGRKQGK